MTKANVGFEELMASLFDQDDPSDSALSDAQANAAVVSVMVPVAIGEIYSYRSPQGLLEPGTFVQVPLGPRKIVGVVWAQSNSTAVAATKLRDIEKVFPTPPLSQDVRRFVDWVAAYTMTPAGMVLRMVIRVPEALEPEPPLPGVRLTNHRPDRLTDARRRTIETAQDGFAWTRSGLAKVAGVSASVIDGLITQGVFETVELPALPPMARAETERDPILLTEAQALAVERLRGRAAQQAFSVTLLDGVTGSGKTDVYLEAVAEVLRSGRQALVLLPEIALTQSLIGRFEARFGVRPGEWHSNVPPKARQRLWRSVAMGEAQIVLGARSALFLPFPNLGLIVIDEEHDPAYKQDDGVAYNARDMAIVRGHLSKLPIVLVSATPSIESQTNVEAGRYQALVLPSRVGGQAMPDLQAIDLRRDQPERGCWLSPPLIEAVNETLQAGDQALLFLNRRGYAPLTLCRSCGYRFNCPNCTTWLVEHRFRGQLNCHHCGYSRPAPQHCPNCGDLDSLVACGPGIERLDEEAAERFPEARRIVLSSDITGGAERMRREFQAVADGEADLIIGTQLVAKGHTFPLLKLVGVVDADLGLENGDLRASERTFQLLSQVTGRAGRVGTAGRALIQTYQPDHPVMSALVAGDRDGFYEAEIEARQRTRMPPFGRLAALIVASPEREAAWAYARQLAEQAPHTEAVSVLGPADAPLAVVRGRHRVRFLLRGERTAPVQRVIAEWLDRAGKPRGSTRLAIDIDPVSFL